MPEDDENVTSAGTKRTPYEIAWWVWLVVLVGCFVAMVMNVMTAHTVQPVPMALFWLTFLMSALLGVYSLLLLTRLPSAMAICGIAQGCLFGFNVLGRFLIAWIAKMTT